MKEVDQYKGKLSRLDTYLQLNPQKCHDEYVALLKIAKEKSNESLETILHIYRGTILYYTGKNDSAVVYFDKAISLATKIGNEQLRASASIRRIFVIDGTSDIKISMRLMRDEYNEAKKYKDTLNMIYAINGIAMYYERMDSTKQCIDYYMRGIKLAQKNNNEFEYGFLLNNFGLLKLRLKDPSEALVDFKKGTEIAKRLENIRLELILKENIGYYYMEVDSLDKAEKEYQDALQIARSKNFTHLAFNSFINLGVLERQRGNQNKADSLMDVALKTAMTEKLYYAVSPIYLNMTQIAISQGKYAQAESLLDSAIYYGDYTSQNEIQEGYFVLNYQMKQKQGDYKSALEYYKKLTSFRDSIDRNGHLQMVKELQLKYDVQKKEKQRIEEKNAYEKKIAKGALDNALLKQNIGIGLTLVIIAIGGFVIYHFRQKHKKEIEFSSAIVNKLEEERGRIARDLHDGLGQNLIILKNKFNKLEIPDSASTALINDNFTETIEQIRSISRSLIPPELRRLGLKQAIIKMLKEVENSSMLMTTAELDELKSIKLDSGQEIRIYRILQELANNTLKHSQASSLKIEFRKTDNGFSIIYQDNGKGIDHEILQHERNSVGLKSIEQRLRYLNGTIRYEKPQKGFKAVIKIKNKG